MLLDPIPPAKAAPIPRETASSETPLLGAVAGGPAHCQEPMRLTVARDDDLGGAPGPLEWRCRCGFRLDAGLVPLPFPGLHAFPEMHDAGAVA